MRVTALVENISNGPLKAVHGLSLFIETKKHKLLFDLGPDDTIFENAEALGVDLTQVDTVILSHGHNDHGGALGQFLEINQTAKIYLQKNAFKPHFAKLPAGTVDVGIDPALKNHPQIVLLDGDTVIDEELQVFQVENTGKYHSIANDILYDERGRDKFSHEQNLIITEKENYLIMGCGHCGIVNILEKAEKFQPKLCIGGYHLSVAGAVVVPEGHLDEIKERMSGYTEISFYTCHCTGTMAYNYLSEGMPNLHYLHCGDQIEIQA